MTEIFDEISDDLREQKLHQFWKENGPWIVGGAIGAVLLTATLTFWREHENQRNTDATTQLITLEKAADLPKLESFAAATDKNHAMIARFAEADTYLSRKENDKALAVYKTIADTSGLDKTWRDLARLHSVSLRLDKDAPDALAKELDALAGNDGVWRYSAREMQALLAARQGQPQKAADILDGIAADPLAPEDMRHRALSLRQFYSADTTTSQKP